MSKLIRVVIVDDMKLWRDSFSLLLNSLPNIKVVGSVSEGGELFDLMKKIPFDILLLDIEMRFGMDGIKTLEVAKEHFPNLKIIMMSTHNDTSLVKFCLEKGAKAYLSKDTDADILLEYINKVYNGEDCYTSSSELSNKSSEELYRELFIKYKLTEKELDVLFLLCKGQAIKLLADELKLSERSVQRYIESIYKKTNSQSKADMISFGIKNGIAW